MIQKFIEGERIDKLSVINASIARQRAVISRKIMEAARDPLLDSIGYMNRYKKYRFNEAGLDLNQIRSSSGRVRVIDW
jgi:hypothetical protein